MKKLVLFVCLSLSACALFAQAKKADTTKLAASSAKKADGASMHSSNDITRNIALSKELSTFFKILQAARLDDTFSSKGLITVFAANNQAFANLPPGKLDTLLMPVHKYDLIALITYHALAGKVTAKDIAHQISTHKGVATFITLTGSKLTAKLDANHNIILIDEKGGQSTISRFDIAQSNGVIHIINGVLIPKFKNI